MIRNRREKRCVLGATTMLCLAAMLAHAAEPAFDANAASLDELFFHVQRYATTELKKECKRLAREELLARGTETLAYLAENSTITNGWIYILADQLVPKLEAAEAAPILLANVQAQNDNRRRFATFFLGFYDVPGYAPAILPLLKHDKLAGLAIRTLGKWRVKQAVPRILPFLKADKERRRILAANALGEIGAPETVPALLDALHDPFFTVRRAAGRALVRLGRPAEKAALAALNTDNCSVQRELIRVLQAMKSRHALKPLRRMLADQDPLLRADAARALVAIDADAARKWLKQAGIDPAPFLLHGAAETGR